MQQGSQWIQELRHDEALRNHLNQLTASSDSARTAYLYEGYGRRLAWHARVRALKARPVVETEVDKGLGSCVLAATLLLNRAEGHSGRYLGTDTIPRPAGCSMALTARLERSSRRSIESLQRLEGPIDLFINDSDHSAEYEEREYACISPKLYQFAVAIGRRFLFFSDKPSDHWYPGAGIGAAWDQEQATPEAAASVVF